MNTQKLKGVLIAALTLLVFLLANGLASRGLSSTKIANTRNAGPSLTMALDSLDGLEIQAVGDSGPTAVKVKSDVATYRGRRAVHMLNDDSAVPQGRLAGGQALGLVKGSDFKDGAIEVDLVGMPREGAPAGTRGFVGIAFRVQDHGSRFEAFYLRFANGRADDQLQRNHTIRVAP